jgi:hypothetical protein
MYCCLLRYKWFQTASTTSSTASEASKDQSEVHCYCEEKSDWLAQVTYTYLQTSVIYKFALVSSIDNQPYSIFWEVIEQIDNPKD